MVHVCSSGWCNNKERVAIKDTVPIDGFEFLNSKRSTLPAFKQSTRNSAGQVNRTQCEGLPFSLLRVVCVEALL